MTEETINLSHKETLYDLMVHEEKRPIKVAIVAAVIFHLLLFIVRFPQLMSNVITIQDTVVEIRQLARPAAQRGGQPKPRQAPPQTSVPKPKPVFVPVPDLTPNDPEPIYEEQEEILPDLKGQLSTQLSLGDIYGPPSASGGGSGPLDGTGGGTGGDGVYTVGAGVIGPEAIQAPIPQYTNDAIRNRISGVVLLYGIVRRNGRVDSLKVIRGLGYGLDEEALETVATKWRFKPAMKEGRPVDCYVTIEVKFTLY
jgi:TonB family protein